MANKLTKIIAGVLIAVAILLGLFALFLGRRSAPPPDMNQPVAKAIYPIVVASSPLVPGQPITADQLKLQQVATVPPGAFTDPASAVGRVPANPIPANAPVVEGGLTSGLSDLLQPGERAVAVKVDDISAVGNRIRPGNYVDVFLNLKRDPTSNGMAPLPGTGGALGSDIPVSQARLLLSRVRVLQFGDATPNQDAGANGNTNNNVNPQSVHTVILAVPTEDIDTLTVAQTNGLLSLALRSPRDTDVASSPVAVPASSPDFADPSARAAAGVALSVLSNNLAGKPQGRAASVGLPVPPHYHPHPRVVHAAPGGSLEVIRGGQTETVTY